MYLDSCDSDFPFPSFTRMAVKFAPELGIEVEVIDRRHGYLLALKNEEAVLHLLADANPFNSNTSTRLARDKIYTNILLEKYGLPLPEGSYFFFPGRFTRYRYEVNKGPQEALDFARNLGYPLVIKPNASSMGNCVFLVEKEAELEDRIAYLEEELPEERIFLLQEFVPGREMRVIFLDGEVLLAIEKAPFSITTSGEDTVEELILEKWDKLGLQGEKLDLKALEERLVSQGLTLESVPGKNQTIVLDEVAYNLHRGATAWEVENLSEEIVERGKKVMEVLGLRYGGIDLKVDENNGVKAILEVNSNAGFYRFSQMGEKEWKKAKELYQTIFRRLFLL